MEKVMQAGRPSLGAISRKQLFDHLARAAEVSPHIAAAFDGPFLSVARAAATRYDAERNAALAAAAPPGPDAPAEADLRQAPIGLQATTGTPDPRPHTAKTQTDLEFLRKTHPELIAAESDLDKRSMPQSWLDWIFDTGRESGLLAYSNDSDPNAPFIIKPQDSVKGSSGYYDVIPAPRSGIYPSIPGYTLQVIEHNHPFPTWSIRWKNSHDPLPSGVDQDIAYKNPTAYSVLRRAGDRVNPNIYYGPRTRY